MRLTASVIVATLLAFNVACRSAGQGGLRTGVVAGQTRQTDLSKLTPNSEPVTIRFQNAQFIDVISFLGQASGIQIRLAPDVNVPKEPLTINFANAKFANVFNFLVTAAYLSYTVVDEKTVLITKRS